MERLERLADAASIGVLLIVAVVAGKTFRDYGLGWDDYTHAQYGELLLEFYRSGFQDQRALSFVNLFMYGGGFDMAAALIDRVTPFELFETRRLCGALVGLIGLTVTWLLARRIGGPLAGCVAVTLLATSPQFYGHMFINPKDAPFAVAMVFLLYALVLALEDYPRPRWSAVLAVGVGFGLSVGARIMGGLAVLYVIPPVLMLATSDALQSGWRAALRRFGQFTLYMLAAAIPAIAVCALVWPWVAFDPLNLFRAVGYFSHFFEKPWKEMFEGALISVPDMPRSYVPVLLSLKTQELMLLLYLAGLAGSAAAIVRGQLDMHRRAILTLIVLAAALPVAIAVLTRPAMYNGIRHFLFLLPPMAVIAGLAGAFILRRAVQAGRLAGAAAGLVFAAGLLLPVSHMVRLHPYQYTYFNAIAGGVEAADERYMLDYWGLAFKQAGQRLREILTERAESAPPGRRWSIAVCGPHSAAQVELGPEFLPTWDPSNADFALSLGTFYCADLDAPVLVEIEREGVIYARVYDIRGIKVPGIFTMQPIR